MSGHDECQDLFLQGETKPRFVGGEDKRRGNDHSARRIIDEGVRAPADD